MSGSGLTEAIAEITREFERQSSGVVRHFQWHEEMAAELVRFLPDSGYVIVEKERLED